MVDVSRWLAEQGLGHYAEAFAKNGIAGDILRDLTDTDLKELGLNLGDRKRLLKAIAALDAGPTQDRVMPAEPIATAAVPREAERRQLTVMFVDLVGSTALSQRLDPEEMSQVLRDYQNTVAGEIARFEGHVAKYMGDGVLAYFGWPQAHEDDAERAVRAGLELAAAVGRLRPGDDTPLAARVGIATGLVMVGELIGEGAAREETVVGDTPNLAARLQALAEPGAVVVAASTRRLLGGLFELTDLGPTRLKGFAEPLAAFRVEGEGRAESRFEALHGQRLTPLVGREQELAILLERWAWAKDGDGQVVLLAGEPGIGKSRLLRALRQELSGEPHLGLSHFCSPYHTNSALYPIIAQLERAAGFAADDVPEAKLAKLETLLRQAMNRLDEAAPLISALLGVPSDARYPALNLSPQRQKQRTLEVLIEQLAGLARDRPVVELYEDVHWVDPSTLELLDLLVERVRALPVLAVLTYRPEFSPPWTGHAHVTSLPLNRLGRRQGAAMVERVMGGKALPAEVLEQVVARTDGVPLFVEELTKTVLESGLLTDTGDRYELTGPLPPLAIPATLQDSLMARLDRLAPVKEVAQTAAVIGREFSHELIVAVSPLSEADLDTALDQLVASELVFRRGAPPDASYSFKHALVQDAAYGTLLRGRRRQLHAAIARVLEQRWKAAAVNATADGPEIVAHHFTEAGLPEPAAAWWLRAGQLAVARSAYVEALHHLRRGLDVLGGLPTTRERTERQLRLWRALGAALAVVRGYAAPETGQAFERALALCRELGDEGQLFPVLYGFWVSRINRSEFAGGEEVAREFLGRAERLADASLLLIGHTLVGSVQLMRGEFVAARAAYERTIALYKPDQHRALVADYVTDRGVVGKQLLALALGPLGHWDLARRYTREALVEARGLGHPATEAYALWLGMVLWQVVGEVDTVDAHAERLTGLARELRAAYWLGIATAYRGWVRAARGEAATAIPTIGDGIVTFRATGATYLLPHYLTMLAAAHRAAGDDAAALAVIAQAAAEARRTGEGWSLAEILRLQGEVLASTRTPDLAGGVACLCGAVELARTQDARGWELRAATSLARLWAERGERAKAFDLLAPVYGWFTEGVDTPDLIEAKGLLDALA